MSPPEPKAELHRYLQAAREALLWKLEGLPEYDIRRPLTPTGTNLLGLVKHVASVELGYFGETFGRPSDEPLPWLAADAEPNADMWATAEQSRADVIQLYRRVWAHSDATIAALDLDAIGHVPWWPSERNEVTLRRILVHMVAETNRHAGHADIVRELVDGEVGLRADNDNIPPVDEAWWTDYRDRLERTAREASPSAPAPGPSA
ncbi:MAG TPA: DinB family protein [Cellulomonas sp.]|uniref:DinB family protein n=1 Tax=Cellulomonas sp. TaxID=40001 RepID=UPI002E2F51ED|nr:DinB family protein [Cellulomonas sp.]HEX5331921.1 DinB family protein [Cellulomonas sp.]